MKPEQIARAKIDDLLTKAGWKFQTEVHAPGSERDGRIDYLLVDSNGVAKALLEAKAGHIDPLAGKEQARDYAKSKWDIQYVILSNGVEHNAWDTRNGNPTLVLSIPSPDKIDRQMRKRTVDRSHLWKTQVMEGYLPAGSGRIMRPYQIEAVNAIQKAAKSGETAHLLEMATGTGKTTVAAAMIYLYISTGNAERVMFLVDRIELRQQAADDIRAALDTQYTVDVYHGQHDYDWDSTHVTVISIQTLDRMLTIPKTHFDLIITDEAHRCISGPSRRMLFESLEGEKVGLTATPRAMLNAEAINPSDASRFAEDQRSLRDTYVAFGKPSGEPTYSYTMEDGLNDGYLVGPTAVDVRTDVTKQLMSEEGLAMDVPVHGFDESEEDQTKEQTFRAGNFGREFLSPATRREFAEEIIAQTLYEPETGLMGKTIAYAASQKEAHALANALNEIAMEQWPGVYQSDFAVVITADVSGAAEYGRQFKNNDLHGSHPGALGRHTSKTRVCVTVAMMTTGYDCRDLLNIAICRTMYSPTEFTQVKGRGTRKYDFRDNVTDVLEREEVQSYPKGQFKIIDFFGVCETHHEGHIYEPSLPKEPQKKDEPDVPGEPPTKSAESGTFIYRGPDKVEATTELDFGNDGNTIVNRTRSEIRETAKKERETVADSLRAAFAGYCEQNPFADETQREAACNLFESYATDTEVREAIDYETYSKLNGTTLPLSTYRLVPAEHRERIAEYVKHHLLGNRKAT